MPFVFNCIFRVYSVVGDLFRFVFVVIFITWVSISVNSTRTRFVLYIFIYFFFLTLTLAVHDKNTNVKTVLSFSRWQLFSQSLLFVQCVFRFGWFFSGNVYKIRDSCCLAFQSKTNPLKINKWFILVEVGVIFAKRFNSREKKRKKTFPRMDKISRARPRFRVVQTKECMRKTVCSNKILDGEQWKFWCCDFFFALRLPLIQSLVGCL